MSKRAEQRALEAYPDTYTKYRKEDDPEGVESGICTFPNTHNLERIAFVNGYEQAEKDLALTWEDIKTIEQIIATSDWYDFEINGKLWSKEFYDRRTNEHGRDAAMLVFGR